MMKTITLNNIDETIKLGALLGRLLKPGDIIALSGELGSGKTTLTKGIAKGMGVKDSKYVNSPSFVIVKEHKGRIPLYHFDVYRLDDPSDLDTVGYKEYFYGKGVTVIEWADKIPQLLPEDRLEINLSVKSETKREVVLITHGIKSENLLKHL